MDTRQLKIEQQYNGNGLYTGTMKLRNKESEYHIATVTACAEVDAAELVRRYNAFPQLVEALKLAMEWSDDGTPDTERSSIEIAFRDSARAILKSLEQSHGN